MRLESGETERVPGYGLINDWWYEVIRVERVVAVWMWCENWGFESRNQRKRDWKRTDLHPNPSFDSRRLPRVPGHTAHLFFLITLFLFLFFSAAKQRTIVTRYNFFWIGLKLEFNPVYLPFPSHFIGPHSNTQKFCIAVPVCGFFFFLGQRIFIK